MIKHLYQEDIMKKTILVVFSLILAVTLSGCMGSKGPSLENVEIASAPDASTIKDSEYKQRVIEVIAEKVTFLSSAKKGSEKE